jgi:hypothetical protein
MIMMQIRDEPAGGGLSMGDGLPRR